VSSFAVSACAALVLTSMTTVDYQNDFHRTALPLMLTALGSAAVVSAPQTRYGLKLPLGETPTVPSADSEFARLSSGPEGCWEALCGTGRGFASAGKGFIGPA
jgi:hypothetical protein